MASGLTYIIVFHKQPLLHSTLLSYFCCCPLLAHCSYHAHLPVVSGSKYLFAADCCEGRDICYALVLSKVQGPNSPATRPYLATGVSSQCEAICAAVLPTSDLHAVLTAWRCTPWLRYETTRHAPAGSGASAFGPPKPQSSSSLTRHGLVFNFSLSFIQVSTIVWVAGPIKLTLSVYCSPLPSPESPWWRKSWRPYGPRVDPWPRRLAA